MQPAGRESVLNVPGNKSQNVSFRGTSREPQGLTKQQTAKQARSTLFLAAVLQQSES